MPLPPRPVPSQSPSTGARLRALLFHVEAGTSPVVLAGRAVILLGFACWSLRFLRCWPEDDAIGESFMHLVHLPFHEAGHVLFSPFGHFLHALGGTLGQLLMPVICLANFLVWRRDPFSASIMLWWLGESFVDCAPYINDARALRLVLIGGIDARDSTGHDWENILSTLRWLGHDRALAFASLDLGKALMVLALGWGAAVLVRQARAR